MATMYSYTVKVHPQSPPDSPFDVVIQAPNSYQAQRTVEMQFGGPDKVYVSFVCENK